MIVFKNSINLVHEEFRIHFYSNSEHRCCLLILNQVLISSGIYNLNCNESQISVN